MESAKVLLFVVCILFHQGNVNSAPADDVKASAGASTPDANGEVKPEIKSEVHDSVQEAQHSPTTQSATATAAAINTGSVPAAEALATGATRYDDQIPNQVQGAIVQNNDALYREPANAYVAAQPLPYTIGRYDDPRLSYAPSWSSPPYRQGFDFADQNALGPFDNAPARYGFDANSRNFDGSFGSYGYRSGQLPYIPGVWPTGDQFRHQGFSILRDQTPPSYSPYAPQLQFYGPSPDFPAARSQTNGNAPLSNPYWNGYSYSYSTPYFGTAPAYGGAGQGGYSDPGALPQVTV